MDFDMAKLLIEPNLGIGGGDVKYNISIKPDQRRTALIEQAVRNTLRGAGEWPFCLVGDISSDGPKNIEVRLFPAVTAERDVGQFLPRVRSEFRRLEAENG